MPNQHTPPQTTLPPDWRWARLGEMCEFKRGPFGGSLKKEVFVTSGYKVYEQKHAIQNNFTIGSYFIDEAKFQEMIVFSVKPGDLIVSCSGTMGRVAIVPSDAQPGIINQALLKLTPLLHIVWPQYLRDYLQSEPVQLRYFRQTAGAAIQNVASVSVLKEIPIPLPPLPEQRRIAAILTDQLAAVERARAAAEEQVELLAKLVESYLRHSFSAASVRRIKLSQCLHEVSHGVGSSWGDYRIVGATRAGIAPAKEKVGKRPERYKLVDAGTIFYNPMRILIGSIAMIDEGDEPGITSPDYVVFKTQGGILHPRWFYYWLRSSYGEAFIKTLARGAVRERMLFRRLSAAEVDIPDWEIQVKAAQKLRMVVQAKEPLAQQIDAINALPAALLRRAFAGEL